MTAQPRRPARKAKPPAPPQNLLRADRVSVHLLLARGPLEQRGRFLKKVLDFSPHLR